MAEVSEAIAGKNIVSFDGRVLEVFGFHDPIRYHVAELQVKFEGPDKKGRYDVTVGSRNRGSAVFRVEAEAWPALEPVLQEARDAAADAAPPA